MLIATSLADLQDRAPVYRPASVALGVAAGVAPGLGWLAPPPGLNLLLLTVVLGGVWLFGVLTWLPFAHHPRQLYPASAPSASHPLATGLGQRRASRTAA